MSINTTYDSKTELLRVNSGNASKTSASSTTSTANSSTDTTKDTDSTSWSSLALSLSDSSSEYISPILKLKAQNETLQTQLTKTLAAKFEDLGVDTSQTITLGRDADGNVVVQGNNADKAKIDKLFADTPALTEAFNTLADNSTTLKSMTSSQSASLVRTNGYSAYLNQLTSDSSSDDYLLSMLGDSSTSYFS